MLLLSCLLILIGSACTSEVKKEKSSEESTAKERERSPYEGAFASESDSQSVLVIFQRPEGRFDFVGELFEFNGRLPAAEEFVKNHGEYPFTNIPEVKMNDDAEFLAPPLGVGRYVWTLEDNFDLECIDRSNFENTGSLILKCRPEYFYP